MTTLATAIIEARPDFTRAGVEMRRGTEKAAKDAGTHAGEQFHTSAMGGVKRLAGSVAGVFAGLSIGQLLKDAVGDAAGLAETQSKVRTIFGTSADAVLGFGRTAATSLGQSQQSALDAASTFAIFGRSAGLSGQQLVGFSTDMTKLATDLASFNNTSPEQAIEAIGSALRGESEPIRAYGVLLDEATLRNRALKLGLIETTTQALTPQQKVLAAQAEILAQTSLQQGDFARTQAGAANQARIAAAEYANLKTQVGDLLLPAWQRLLAFIRDSVLPAFSALFDGIRDGQVTTSGFTGRMQELGARLRDVFDFLGGTVLPVLGTFGRFLLDHQRLVVAVIGAYVAWRVAVMAWSVQQGIAKAIQAVSTEGTVANTVVTRINTTARAISMSTLGTWIGVKAIELVAWIRSTAATIAATVATVAHTAATVALRIATAAWAATQWLLNAALAANPIGIVIVLLAALAAAIIYAYNHSKTFREIVQAAWAGIKTAAEVSWRFLSGVFSQMARWITVDLPNAWNRLADSVAGVWNRIKDVSRSAAEWVVRNVINPLVIKPFNKVSGMVGGPTIPEIGIAGLGGGGGRPGNFAAFATGGVFPGYSPGRDNLVAPLAAFSGGEAVMVPEWTRAVGGRQVIDAWNKAARQGGPVALAEQMAASMPRYADGGIVDALTNPGGFLRGQLGNLAGLVGRFGDNPWVQMLARIPRKLADLAANKIEKLLSVGGAIGGALGRAGGAIGWAAMWAIIKAAFPSARLFSGFRAGDRAASGLSYHAFGRAIDITPSIAIGRWIAANFGALTKELIHTPMGAEQIWNGRRHVFTGAALRAAHYDHVHWAMSHGGVLGPLAQVASADFGSLTLRPGWNLTHNGTGGDERMTAGPVRLDEWTLARLAQALSSRPLVVQLSGGAETYTVAGMPT